MSPEEHESERSVPASSVGVRGFTPGDPVEDYGREGVE
jgi:hypothetical protein